MVAPGDTGGLTAPSPGRFQVGIAGDATAPLSDLRAGFKSAYVFEIQDLRQQLPLDVHVLALNPERYTLSEPFQSTLTPTEDNTVVAEENGTIIRELTIEGTTGLRNKRGPAFNGDQGALSGTEHFKHLRNLFRCYSAFKQDPRRAANIRMVFHSLRDDDHFVVVPRVFDTPRDARTTRLHYAYRITLAVIANVDNTLRPLDLDEGFDFFTDELAAIGGAFNDARAAFAEVTADLSAVKRKVGNIQSVMLQAAGLINATGNMLRAAGNLIEFPFQLVASVLDTVDNATDKLGDAILNTDDRTLDNIERSMRRMSSALDRIAMVPNRFGPDPLERTRRGFEGERQLTGQDIDARVSGASLGTRTRLSVGTGRESGLDLGEYRGIRRVQVTRTDTVTNLASRHATTEVLIILINDLRFPYIAEGGGPGILKPGDIILIPVSDALGVEGVQPQNEYLSADDALYGVDLALDPVALQENRLELRVNVAGGSLDADLSRGIKNVIQGTEITVRTERGATAFVPEVGLSRSVGVKGTIQHVIMASLNLREGILADPRIEGIQDTTVVLEGDVLTQEISPRLKGESEGVTLVLPFGRASGE